jgi:HlyD family secretion protein
MDKVKNLLEQTKAKARTWSLRRKIFYGVLVLFAVLLFLKFFGNNSTQSFVYDTVVRTDLLQSIKATGKVTSKTDLSLSFSSSGVVRSVRVEVGQEVYKGQILANLDQASELAEVTSARGALAAAQAKYAKINNSYTPEEISLAQVLLDNAKKDYENTKIQQDLIVDNAYTTAKYLSRTSDEAKINDFKYENALKTRTSTLASLQATINQRQSELNIKLANANTADVDLAQADILQAEGKLEGALAKLEDTIIRAPANGTITRVDTKIGELSQANKEVIVLQDVSNLYIESSINEANIANVKLDQPVRFTFDSMPDRQFDGTVVHIDPSATTDDGVVNYKIKSSIPNNDASIRVGMNANIVIVAGEKKGVLALPKEAVIVVDGKNVVKSVINEKKNKFKDVEVSTGFLGDGNLLEIVSGLSEGDRIAYTK